MRSTLLVLASLLPACSLYFGGDPPPSGDDTPTPQLAQYDLEPVAAIGYEHPIVGVDSDRHGGLWVVSRDPAPDGAPANVWVTHLDAQHAKLSEWNLHDDATPVHGIAYTGDAVWLNYAAPTADGNSHLRALDANTGETRTTFATATGIVDLEAVDGEVAISNLWNQVDAIDPVTGGIVWRTSIGATFYSTQSGLAYDGARLWIASWYSGGTIYLVDQTGALLGEAHTPLVESTVAVDLPLAWDGEQLVLVANNQITWLAVHPRS